MKLILFVISVCHLIYPNSFEGKIKYQNTYKSKVPNVTSEQFDEMMGTVQEYFIKGDKYKSIGNGSFSQWQLYIPLENRLYSKLAISDTIYWVDGKSNPDEVVSFELQKGKENILGFMCDALVLQTNTGQTTYYFSEKVKTNSELFKDHLYGNWAFMTKQTGSLPLKTVMETPQFTLVSIAKEINEMKIEDNFFDLPNAPIKKSPF